MDWRGSISFVVLSAGLVGAVSYFGPPDANTERAATLVSSGPSREPLPQDQGRAAKAFRTFAPQGTWFNTVPAGAMEGTVTLIGNFEAETDLIEDLKYALDATVRAQDKTESSVTKPSAFWPAGIRVEK